MTHEQRRLIGEKEHAACGCDPTDTVLIALSGGADSTALLLAMHELYAAGKIGGLFAAHLNHGIRGENAARDQRFCEALCERHSIPFITETADVPAYAKARGQSLEQAAREVRYAFLERTRVSLGASVIATAHHRDDQAETLLLNLIRGSGTTGLGGMKLRNGNIVRPMLFISRGEILTYLSQKGETYCEDETNAENTAVRNRVRNELVPMLKRFNPAIAESLCKTAELLAEDEALLSMLADDAEETISLGKGLCRDRLAALPLPIGSRIVRKRLLALCGNVSNADVRRVFALTSAKTGTVIELTGGFSAWTDAQTLFVGAYPDVLQYEVPFVLNGETVTPHGAWMSERVSSWKKPEDGFEAFLDFDKLPKHLVVRSRREGDRFFPLGAPGEKKLSDVLTDRKIAKERRDLPLLCGGNEVYYAAGLTVSERARVTPDTREILHIICYRGTGD
ncbi:MAG: tRNA lysidine(34) synthetase TilS [Eubacteriales bacterium]|nr:tRNA lysidine(34) synthetase TilS [Eubacteriales bacterium]